jgi:hypothetical protein
MYIDKLLKISDAQAVTASDVGTNVIDLSVERSIGNGEPMAMVFSVGVAAKVSATDEDYTFNVEYSTDAAQTTGRQIMGSRVFESGTPTAPAQDADLLAVGFVFAIPIPPTTLAEDGQFIGVRYVTAGTSPAITIDSWLAPLADVGQYVSYADNVTIG